jgi:hypothetical protein
MGTVIELMIMSPGRLSPWLESAVFAHRLRSKNASKKPFRIASVIPTYLLQTLLRSTARFLLTSWWPGQLEHNLSTTSALREYRAADKAYANNDILEQHAGGDSCRLGCLKRFWYTAISFSLQKHLAQSLLNRATNINGRYEPPFAFTDIAIERTVFENNRFSIDA